MAHPQGKRPGKLLLGFGLLAALAACERAQRLDPGDLLLAEGKAAEAIGAWQQALATRPNDTKLLTRIAAAQARLGELAEAETTMLRAAAIEPQSPRVRQNLALVYFRQKRFDKALAAFDDVLERQATYPETHYYIGLIHEMRGDEEKAVKHYVLDVNNGPSRAWERLERYKERRRAAGLASRGPEPRSVVVLCAVLLVLAAAAYGWRLYLDRRGEGPSNLPES